MATSGRPAVTPERLRQFAWGYAPPLIIEAAVRHGVFDALDSGAKSAEALAGQSGASLRGMRAILNALTGLNLLTRDEEGRYALAPESAAYLVSGKPGCMAGLFRRNSKHSIPNWLQLTDVVKTGKPALNAHSAHEGAEFFAGFVEELFAANYPSASALGEALRVADARKPIRILDLAAGSGVWGIALAKQSDQVAVTALDWPGVLEVTRRCAARHGVDRRFSYLAGSLFESDFGSGYDIVTIGYFLHGESRDRCAGLLRKVFDAMAPGGTVAIAEFLVDDTRTGPPSGVIFAVNMVVMTEEGDTYSFEEIARWLRDAGFESPRLLEAPGPAPLVLANRPA